MDTKPTRWQYALTSLLIAVVCGALVHSVVAGSVAEASTTGQATPHPPTTMVEPRVLRSDQSGVLLTLSPSRPVLSQRTLGQETCTEIEMAGYAPMGKPGHPDLSARLITVGIPPDADPTVSVVHAETNVRRVDEPICPAPAAAVLNPDGPDDGRMRGQATLTYDRNPAAYTSAAPYPEQIAEVVGTGYIRSQRVAQIRVAPVQYVPGTGELLYHDDIQLNLRFGPGDTAEDGIARGAKQDANSIVDEGSFEDALASLLVNYEDARQWRVRRVVSQPAAIAAEPAAEADQYRVEVIDAGLYQITYADLVAAGIDPSTVDPSKLHLTSLGTEVAIQVVGGSDGVLDPQDSVRFYGEAIESIYTDINTYWLSWDTTDGVRMVVADQSATTGSSGADHHIYVQHLEEDLFYAQNDASDGDRWHWDSTYWIDLQTKAFVTTATLASPATMPQTATLRALLNGDPYQSNDHSVEMLLNDHSLGTDEWHEGDQHLAERAIPAGWLTEFGNAVTLTLRIGALPASWDYVLVNWLELEYGSRLVADDGLLAFTVEQTGTYTVTGFLTDSLHLYNVTDLRSPVVVSATTGYDPGQSEYYVTFKHGSGQPTDYVAVASSQLRTPESISPDEISDLGQTDNQADYIIVSHGDFITAVQPLADYHASRGMNVVIADVQDIYDEFGYGITGAEPIRDFLQFTYDSWTLPAASYVLLVGDGNYDPMANYGFPETNYLPPYLADVDPWVGEVPADNRYVTVSGEDILPDMHLGRLPVKTVTETVALVDKILNYGQNQAVETWQQGITFVAGRADDGAGDFHYYSDRVADKQALLPYQVDKLYVGTVTHTLESEVRADLLAALNDGRLVVNYAGHGVIRAWGTGYDKLLRASDVAGLSNGDRLPLVLPMTCDEGYYAIPSSSSRDNSSVGESLVRAPNGGAIASWSPMGWGYAIDHDYLDRGIFEALFEEDIVELGPAATYAKHHLAGSLGINHYLLDTYLLFGDPATRLKVLPADLTIEKTTVGDQYAFEGGDAITYTLTYTNAGPAAAHRVTISDTLPAGIVSPSWSASGAVITQQLPSQYVWDVQDLPAGTGGVITISGRINGSLTGTLTNTAEIATTSVVSDEATMADEMVITVDPGITDVRITSLDLHLEPGRSLPVLPGDPVTVTLTYDNLSPGTARDVVLTGTLPSLLTNTAVTVTGATATLRPGSTYVWDIEDLVDGAGGEITFTGVMSRSLYTGPLTTTAEIATSSPEASVENNRMELVTAASARLIYMPIIPRDAP